MLSSTSSLCDESESGSVLSDDDKVETDSRSIYVGNVDYETTAEELRTYFGSCGVVNRVTIGYNKFDGQPKGFAYIEFDDSETVKNALSKDGALFRRRKLIVKPKRTNIPGMSTTNRPPRRARRGCARGRGQLRTARGAFVSRQNTSPNPQALNAFSYQVQQNELLPTSINWANFNIPVPGYSFKEVMKSTDGTEIEGVIENCMGELKRTVTYKFVDGSQRSLVTYPNRATNQIPLPCVEPDSYAQIDTHNVIESQPVSSNIVQEDKPIDVKSKPWYHFSLWK